MPVQPERIREARRAAGLSRQRLAADIDRTYASVTFYENGDVEPPPLVIARIANRLRVPLGYFFGEDHDGA